MLDKKLAAMLNKQINLEWYSAYFYLEVYGYYSEQSLDGFANWFKIQAQEERDHAMLFMEYVLNNNAHLELQDIKAPTMKFKDFKEPLKETLDHELKVTKSINEIYAKAYELKDFRTMQFLDWFIKEQGEEEKNAEDNISKYDLFAKDAKGLYLLNSELAARVYTPATLTL
ncbi:ferritin [Pectinatus brassicae]|uniref:Ferritin n=1 Tax=Pectinatus brassicae TaxID=862415 RepID=A0A840UWH5_9FIRM|nr:ferritin [Pectinatus brassicae]MBB5336765.1 ferritin [Pectinatus brassicae]